MFRKTGALGLGIALTLAMTGCYSPGGPLFDSTGGAQTYYSTEARPTTFTLVDARNNEVLFAVEIPPGTQAGDVFRLSGRGMPDPRRRGLGDLLVQVAIEVPKKVSREEESLLRDLANVERKNVAPHRKSFFEKLKAHFISTEDRLASGE